MMMEKQKHVLSQLAGTARQRGFTIILTALLTVSVLPGTSHAFFWRWDRNVTQNGIEFAKYRQGRGTGTHIGVLKKDTVIQGYPCKKGWVHFYPDWSLKRFFLNESMTINDNFIPYKTWVKLNEEGQIILCTFPHDTLIRGHLCQGTGGTKGTQTSFYPDGKLRGFYPPKAVVIEGIPCKKTPFFNVHLHKNGRLEYCKLAEDTVINGVEYKKNTKMYFDSEGNVTDTK